jgi:hypothetical protein
VHSQGRYAAPGLRRDPNPIIAPNGARDRRPIRGGKRWAASLTRDGVPPLAMHPGPSGANWTFARASGSSKQTVTVAAPGAKIEWGTPRLTAAQLGSFRRNRVPRRPASESHFVFPWQVLRAETSISRLGLFRRKCVLLWSISRDARRCIESACRSIQLRKSDRESKSPRQDRARSPRRSENPGGGGRSSPLAAEPQVVGPGDVGLLLAFGAADHERGRGVGLVHDDHPHRDRPTF